MKEQLKQTQDLIMRDFEMESTSEDLSEEELFNMLADQVAYWIEYKLEFLLSLMYRLDIDEQKVNHALSPYSEEPANIGIARLVLDRQKRRVHSKIAYKQDKIDGWDDF